MMYGCNYTVVVNQYLRLAEATYGTPKEVLTRFGWVAGEAGPSWAW